MQVRTFAAPINGWVANQNMANPPEQGATVLENWFPTSTGIRMRAGSSLGAPPHTVFFRVVMPLARPALAVVGINTFLVNWNNFLYPLILKIGRAHV